MARARAPNCVMCFSFCSADFGLTLPRCEGLHDPKRGGVHFVCQTCHDRFLRRINLAMADCPGCGNGTAYYPTATHPAFLKDVTGDGQDVTMD